MKEATQKLLPLAYNRKSYKQIATDHMVAASSAVNSIVETVIRNGNIETMEFDCEISPVWAIRVIINPNKVSINIEEHDVYEDELINTEIDITNGKSLTQWLEELVLPKLIEEAKTYDYERKEYANENDGY